MVRQGGLKPMGKTGRPARFQSCPDDRTRGTGFLVPSPSQEVPNVAPVR